MIKVEDFVTRETRQIELNKTTEKARRIKEEMEYFKKYKAELVGVIYNEQLETLTNEEAKTVLTMEIEYDINVNDLISKPSIQTIKAPLLFALINQSCIYDGVEMSFSNKITINIKNPFAYEPSDNDFKKWNETVNSEDGEFRFNLGYFFDMDNNSQKCYFASLTKVNKI